MSEYTQNISVAAPNAALLHTLQRHRDILKDYIQEFHKTKSNINAIQEREDLLGAARRDIKYVFSFKSRIREVEYIFLDFLLLILLYNCLDVKHGLGKKTFDHSQSHVTLFNN